MIKLLCFSSLLLAYSIAKSQAPVLADLLQYCTVSPQKFEIQLHRKGYQRDYLAPSQTEKVYTNSAAKKEKNKNVRRTFAMYAVKGYTAVSFQTSSFKESFALKEEIKKAGFHFSGVNEYVNNKDMLFQRGNISVHTSIEIKDTVTYYTFFIQKYHLPAAKELTYVEDLLTLQSDEHLRYVFGEANVARDLFYYTEEETNKCSVLFPNTSREVIFIWEDEINYCNPSFLLIGGHLKTKKKRTANDQVKLNQWVSRQGLYVGISLPELEKLNEEPVNFYSWTMEQAGMLIPATSGKLDWKRLGIVLDCLNCEGSAYPANNVLSSTKAIAANQRVFVSTLIVLPQKAKAATAMH